MILQGSCGVKYNQRTEERRLALAVRAHPTIELLEDRLYVRVHMFSRILNSEFSIYNFFWDFFFDKNNSYIGIIDIGILILKENPFRFRRFKIRENMWWTGYRLSHVGVPVFKILEIKCQLFSSKLHYPVIILGKPIQSLRGEDTNWEQKFWTMTVRKKNLYLMFVRIGSWDKAMRKPIKSLGLMIFCCTLV